MQEYWLSLGLHYRNTYKFARFIYIIICWQALMTLMKADLDLNTQMTKVDDRCVNRDLINKFINDVELEVKKSV